MISGEGKEKALTYRKASIEDLELLTETRVEVLRAANCLSGDADMSEVREQSYRYYQRVPIRHTWRWTGSNLQGQAASAISRLCLHTTIPAAIRRIL